MFLLNSNGYWLYNDINREKEWSFMYEDKKDISFSKEFPKAWATIKSNEEGTIFTSNGYFSYTNIIPNIKNPSKGTTESNPSIILGEGNFTAISFISKDIEQKQLIFTNLYQTILYTVTIQKLVLLFIFPISLCFAIAITINKMSNEQIKYFSEYDTMTGALNRRAGFEQLNVLYQDFMKVGGNISICFSDINSLKQVNDTLGHEAGDELILSVVNGIKAHIRQSDFLIRLGGDEFLIIFVNANQSVAENIWQRINAEYIRINETEKRKYLISASHGIEEFKFSANEYIDEIVNLADEKMYNEKKIVKKDLNVIRKSPL